MPRTFEPQRLLLDTHTWLWLVLGSDTLPAAARAAIGRAVATGGLGIAVITIWEIALLAARGRIVLGLPAMQWSEQAIAASGVFVEPLSPRIAVESCGLPGRFHADPADRMIVATARVTNALLLTRDRQILQYAARGHVRTIAV